MAKFKPIAYTPEEGGYRIHSDDGVDTWMVTDPTTVLPDLPRREPPPEGLPPLDFQRPPGLLDEGSGTLASKSVRSVGPYLVPSEEYAAHEASVRRTDVAPMVPIAEASWARARPQTWGEIANNFESQAEKSPEQAKDPAPAPTPPTQISLPSPPIAAPPPAQVIRTPGGWQSASRTIRPGLNETEDMQNARLGVRGVHERRAELAEERGRLESQQAAGVADILARSNERLERLAEEEREASKSEKIVPLWQQEGNTGAKVMAGLAIALGGFGAAWARDGSPNRGLQAVNDAIDRDIAAQEKNIKLSREARAQRRLEWLDRTKAMLDEYEARGLSDMAQLQAEELKVAIAGQLADQEYELAAARADQYLQQTDVYRPPGVHVVGGARGTPKPLDQGKLVPDGRGGQVLVKSDDEAKKLRGDYALIQSVEQDANEAIHALEAGKTNEFEAATKRLRGSLESLGIQSEELKSRWYWNDTASNKAAVEALKATAFRGYMNKLASQSAKPAVEGYRYDEHGRVQMDSALTGEAPQAVRPAQKTRK